jgi:hypothetical protein
MLHPSSFIFPAPILFLAAAPLSAQPLADLPKEARLALDESWQGGAIDPDRWYSLRKQWGQGNHGVVPENITIVEDIVDGKPVHVLRCTARGDTYKGPVTGQWRRPDRVGGVIVSKEHFASGRFEVVMKIGTPDNPTPRGMVPAIWTYGYRIVHAPDDHPHDEFSPAVPLYHPFLQEFKQGLAFYWSEIDFPEYGKGGDYATPMYNTFLNKQHQALTFDAHGAADGHYHRYTTEWRTHLVPMPAVSADQLVEAEGFFWVKDKAVPYDSYWGNPLVQTAPGEFALCTGRHARHWIDGQFVGENTTFVPSMAAQLNLGVWLPDWAGPAPWDTAHVFFASVKVWQYDDPGDIRGILTEDITDNFTSDGQPAAQ